MNSKNSLTACADNKVAATTIKTMGDIHALIIAADASENEAAAISDIVSGTSTVAAACMAYGLNKEGETQANMVNRFRTRMATIILDVLRNICTPEAKRNAKAAEKLNAEEAAADLAIRVAEWEANGGHGRKPGEGNREKHVIALEKSHAEARRAARRALGIPEQGKIAPEKQEAFVAEFRTIYSEKLTALAVQFPGKITNDPDKIAKMVNKGVKDLAVEKSAQKAGAKAKTVNVPATETATEPEPVV